VRGDGLHTGANSDPFPFLRADTSYITAGRMSTPAKRPGYTGSVDADGLPHGRGTQRYQDGSKYEGEFQHGVIHGQGVYRYASGASYVGCFEKGIRSKKGIYTFGCGTVYDGEYQADKRTGTGVITYSMSAGTAVRSGANSRRAAPPASDTQRNVLHEQTAVARKYVGTFLNGKMHGAGRIEFASGAVYSGPFTEDLENGGVGILVLNDGATRLEASFKDGYPAGNATVVHVNSGEQVRVVFGPAGVIVDQFCNGPSLTRPTLCDFSGGRCSRCGSLRRGELREYLLPPPQRTEPHKDASSTSSACSDVVDDDTANDSASGESFELQDKAKVQATVSNRPQSALAQRRAPRAGTAARRFTDSDSDDDDDATPGVQQATPAAAPSAVDPPIASATRDSSPAASPTAVAETVVLEQIAERISALLREVRAGLGMAIADCVPKSDPSAAVTHIGAEGSALHTTSGTVTSVSPARRNSSGTSGGTTPRDASRGPTTTTPGRSVSPSTIYPGGRQRDGHRGGGGSKVDVRIVQVAPGSPAANYGFARGDYLVSVNGHKVHRKADFTSMSLEPGQQVEVVIQRRRLVASAAGRRSTTPERHANGPGSTGRGEVVAVRATVGCTLMRAELHRLYALQDRVARAMAATPNAPDRLLANDTKVLLKEVTAIVPMRFPQAWDAADLTAYDI
jgi:hypothetical protein